MTTIDLDGLSAYRADPTGAPRGGVILIHEIWGLVPHITGVADRFAAEGYVVIAPDILSGIGMTPRLGQELQALTSDPDEARRTAAQPRLREALAPMREPAFASAAIAQLRKAVDALAAEPGVAGRIAVVGFCFGGTYAFALTAADQRVRAAVAFYGSAPSPDRMSTIGCPVLAIYGGHDPALIDALPDVRSAMADAGVDFTDHVYPDASHAFFNDTGSRYRADDAADAWERTLAFLAESLDR
ncbi:dienelactone hydrolase family protein [Microbacterium pumilum]|uniref:Dienelactone hydrolase family protein n=1 Tax=Microbacterium pumilum TaxID=344165 RepID=A0ABN2SIE1_9MICO